MFADTLISRRSCLCAVLLLLPTLGGCGESAATIAAMERTEFDETVDTKWKKDFIWVEGVQYLEKGGTYFDNGEKGAPAYDKSHVLPLLKRLSAKHGLKWQAILDKKNRSFALAIVAQFPEVEGAQKAVVDTLMEEQKTLPIDILLQHGNHWVSLDFMSRDEADSLKEAQAKK
jgi:hypothetical protein